MCYSKLLIYNPIKEEHLTGFDKPKIKVACCKCAACRRLKSNDWLVRCWYEFLDNPRVAYFVTLDYSDNHLPVWNDKPCFDFEDIKVFTSRLRSNIGAFRYIVVCEYGGFLHRPHYHMIVIPQVDGLSKEKFMLNVHRAWTFGNHCDIECCGSVGNNKMAAIKYICGYTTKDFCYDPELDCDDTMPMRYRPQVRASKGFGLSALELGYITTDMIMNDESINLPVGKNGKILKFRIPRYYELKFTYDYHWNKEEKRAELIKNEQGVKLAKIRHNRHYIAAVKDFLLSRSLDLHNNPSLLPYFEKLNVKFNSWSEYVCDVSSNFEDFREFMYARDFIVRHQYIGSILVPRVTEDGYEWIQDIFGESTSDTFEYLDKVHRSSTWSYYESVLKIYDEYKSLLDYSQNIIEKHKLEQNAKFRALCKIRKNPSLRRYLVRKHFDFSTLNI